MKTKKTYKSKIQQMVFIFLLIIGFILRLSGIFFNGNQNLDTYKDWATKFQTVGLANSFEGGYGPIAYIIMAGGDLMGKSTPQIWWWPYKMSDLIFETIIMISLLFLFKEKKWLILFMYWLNPWFLIPGAWEGFWDAPYALFILFSALILDFNFRGKEKFVWSGLSLGIAAMIKPQVSAPLVALSIYFAIVFITKFTIRDAVRFFIGFTVLPLLFNLYFVSQGKALLFFPKQYSGFLLYMPYLVNSEINIWYTITRIIMYYKHLTGPIYSLNTRVYPYNLMEITAYLLFFLTVIIYIFKSFKNLKGKPHYFFLSIFTLPLILMPQILTRSHAYHFYPATLLLIPLIIFRNDAKLFFFWIISVAIHFYNIFNQYQFGRSIDRLIPLWGDPFVSFLGLIQFMATVGFIYLFLYPIAENQS